MRTATSTAGSSRAFHMWVIGAIALAAVFVALLAGATSARAAAPVDDYPAHLRDAPQGSVRDQWGILNRECTSYVAWRLHRDGVRFTSNNVLIDIMFADDAGPLMAAIGGRVDTTPEVGALIQWKRNEMIYGPDSEADSKFIGYAGGNVGHLAYIEAINPDGSVLVSQYNSYFVGEPQGMWSTENVYLWTGRVLHFRPGDPVGPPPADPPPVEPPVEQPAPPVDQPIDEPVAEPPSRLVCKKRNVSGAPSRPARRVALTDTQMRTNQRIAVEALRRATAMVRRADGRSVPAVKKAKGPSKVTMTLAQLRTNHRIGAHALREAHRAQVKLLGGANAPRIVPAPTRVSAAAVRADQRMSQEALRRVMSINCTRS